MRESLCPKTIHDSPLTIVMVDTLNYRRFSPVYVPGGPREVYPINAATRAAQSA